MTERISDKCLLPLTVGDGLQAIQLEDGTTAYISQSAASLFSEGAAGIDANALNLEQLQAQVCESVIFKGLNFCVRY